MQALKSVVMVNIQSHTRTVFEFPQVGIVRFYGNNSNGKSVLVKVLGDVVSNAITRPVNRRSIIRRGCDYGELTLQRYDGTTLVVHVALEAAATFAELIRPNSQPVRRYLADKSIPLLIKEFGWHFNNDHGVSLNIHKDIDGFLFVDTKKSINFDLLSSVHSDHYAEASAESLETLRKASKKQRNDILHAYEVAQATYTALQYWDIQEEQKISDTCLYFARNLEAMDIPSMPEIRPVPQLENFPVIPSMPPVRIIPIPLVIDTPVPDILKSAAAYKDLKSGICPTCKRKLTDECGC